MKLKNSDKSLVQMLDWTLRLKGVLQPVAKLHIITSSIQIMMAVKEMFALLMEKNYDVYHNVQFVSNCNNNEKYILELFTLCAT